MARYDASNNNGHSHNETDRGCDGGTSTTSFPLRQQSPRKRQRKRTSASRTTPAPPVFQLSMPSTIGGPGTILPRFVESFLSWVFAIGCLSVALFYCHLDRYKTAVSETRGRRENRDDNAGGVSVLLPLTTHSRREWSTVSGSYEGVRSRYYQLLEILGTEIHASSNSTSSEPENERPLHRESSPGMARALATGWLLDGRGKIGGSSDGRDHPPFSFDQLTRMIRTNEAARRLVSLLLADDPIDAWATAATAGGKTNHAKKTWLKRLSGEEPAADFLFTALKETWPMLLELPPPLPSISAPEIFGPSISVVVPAFREDGRALGARLRESMKNAQDPDNLEILVVRVVENEGANHSDLASFAMAVEGELLLYPTTPSDQKRPSLRILDYSGGGGRGPCLNYGAKHARGRIITFLHADTRLATRGWDRAIHGALGGGNNGTASGNQDEMRTTLCAFSFAIDRSPMALKGKASMLPAVAAASTNRNGYYYLPPGLEAIEKTANLRSKWFSLPYGDQCLSVPADLFRYIGGYPDQCLMEDYELIRLLRMRCSSTNVVSVARKEGTVGKNDSGYDDSMVEPLKPLHLPPRERIEILPGHFAVCSPRRWQKFGVLFVTYTNSRCVKRYNEGKVTPDGLFCEYYGTKEAPKRRDGDKSPWEIVPTTKNHGQAMQ